MNKLTRFFKLKKAIRGLDHNYLFKKIAELEENLSNKGKKLEPENTAITQEGIFYIHPESGMATKAVLYEADHRMKLPAAPKQDLYLTGYNDPLVINKFHKYHLVRCNLLVENEKNGWSDSYRLAQRAFPSFYYRIVTAKKGKISSEDVYQEIENQKLLICQNCFMKINSLLEGVSELKRESFELKYFFDVDFFAAWCRYGEYVQEEGTMVKMYPKDWEEICRVRKEQVQHFCEGCETDLSDSRLKKYLHVHPTDHVRQKVGYVKLQCLCLACLADLPNRDYIKETPEYEEFMQIMAKASMPLDEEPQPNL
jgi:hypothetical protein